MIISQVGAPSVCLSSNLVCAGMPQAAGFVAINVPVKVEGRADEDGPMVAEVCSSGGRHLVGKAIEKRSSAAWLLFRISREICPQGGCLTFRALVNEVVLWQRAYRVVWHDRFPGVEPVA